MKIQSGSEITCTKKITQTNSKFPLLDAQNKINEHATFLFTQIFFRYAIEDPDNPDGEKVIMRPQAYKYVQDATGVQEVTTGTDGIMKYDRDGDGKMTLEDFLYFYEESCSTKLSTVRSNLAKMGFRDDLQLMPPPGSPENILQPRKSVNEMPRYKISQNKEYFSLLLSLTDM